MLLAAASSAFAQTRTWNAGAGDWDAAANWSPSGEPTSTGDAVINNGFGPTISTTGNTVRIVRIGSTGTGTLDILSGGALRSFNSAFIGDSAGSVGTVTISGTGLWDWSAAATLQVGGAGAGTLNVTNGGTVINTGTISVGARTGSVGALNVESGFLRTNNLNIGGLGRGGLLIRNSEAITSGATIIGQGAGGPASTAKVEGSTWTTGGITIGSQSRGTLDVTNSSMMTGGVTIGGTTGSGVVTLDNATWMVTGATQVGAAQDGTLNILNGSDYSTTLGFGIGSGANISAGIEGVGTVVVDNSTLTVGEEATIVEIAGFSRDGVLIVRNSGTATFNTQTKVSSRANTTGNGSVLVEDAGSSLTVNGPFVIGANAPGTLTIQDHAVMNSGNATAGSATVLVDDAAWNINGEAALGVRAPATLTIQNGGTVNVADRVEMAAFTNGNATIAIGGTGGTLTAVDVIGGFVNDEGAIIPALGTATLNFDHTSAGIVFAPRIRANIAVNQMGTGTTILTGDSDLTGLTTVSNGVLQIGNGGETGTVLGPVHVAGGATLAFLRSTSNAMMPGSLSGDGAIRFLGTGVSGQSGYETTGDAGGFTGDFIVGPNARLIAVADTHLGSGVVTVENLGQLSLPSAGTYGNPLFLQGEGWGESAGHLGALRLANSADVTGPMTLTGDARITAHLAADAGIISGTIGDGGAGYRLEKTGDGTIILAGSGTHTGDTAVNAGTLAVRGMLDGTARVLAGESGGGTLAVEGGGIVNTPVGIVGFLPGSDGAANVTGAGSTWTSGTLAIGDQGAGALTLADGGTATAGTFLLADQSGSTGNLNIGAAAGAAPAAPGLLDTASVQFGAGAGTVTFNHSALQYFIHTSTDYTFDPALNGNGAVNALAGTTVLTADSSAFAGGTTVSGGRLLVSGVLGGTGVSVGAAGTLGGAGVILGNVSVADGGRLAPGISPGTLTIADDLSLSGASNLDFELGLAGVIGGGVNDLIEVGGDLTLDGLLNVTDTGGFGVGVYRLINYDGALTNNGLDFGILPTGVSPTDLFVQTSIAQQVNLVSAVGQVLSFWDGPASPNNGLIEGGDGVWNTTTPHWTNPSGAVNGLWSGDFAVFTGQAGTVTVEGPVGFTGMQFMTDGYRIVPGAGGVLTTDRTDTIIRVDPNVAAEIAATIQGAGGLVRLGTGTLILSGVNSYSGGTTILGGGTVSVSSDANLGEASGVLTLDRGILQTTATFTSARGITIDAGSGAFHPDATTTLTLAGVIAGEGDLVKGGDGTLRLAGANTYSGNTVVVTGSLVGDTASIRGDLHNGAVTTFDQATDGVFAGEVRGTVLGAGTMVKDGAAALTLAGTSSLDWTIEEGELATAAERFLGDVTINAPGTMRFDQSADAEYAGTISGSGSLFKTGGGLLALTADNPFAGGTTVGAGTLLVHGSIAGPVTVDPGATLGGNGAVGTTTVNGTLSPGASIGTLTVQGDLTLSSGATYQVEISPGAGDRTNASGAAGPAGGVHVAAEDGTYAPGATYTIINAAGGVTGTFGSLTVNREFALLTPTLTYDANNVFFTLVFSGTDFIDLAETPNEMAVAEAAEFLGPGDPVFDALASATPEDARLGFNLLSGELHASALGVMIEDSRFPREAAIERLRQPYGAAAGARRAQDATSLAVTYLNDPGASPDAPAPIRFGPAVWVQGVGAVGRVDSDGNAATLDRALGGVLGGFDLTGGRPWRAGIEAGYTYSSIDIDDRASSADMDSYHVALYGGARFRAFGVRAGGAYSWHDLDTERSIVFSGFSEAADADYHARTAQVFGEVGYELTADAVVLEPFGALSYVNTRADDFIESGGAGALAGNSDTFDQTFSTLGLRLGAEVPLGGGRVLTGRGALGWRHAFDDVEPGRTLAFATSGVPFTIAGVPVAEDSVVVEAGADFTFTPNAILGFSYVGQLASDAQDHALKLTFVLRF